MLVDWFYNLGTFLNNNAGAITALATAFIGIFTYTLYKVTNQLKDIGERQAKALTNLERPWLIIEAVRVERREGAPIKPDMHNKLKNSTNTENL